MFLHCLIFHEMQLDFFFSYSPTFSAACNISCCNIYYPTTRPARPAGLPKFSPVTSSSAAPHLPLISQIISWFIFRTDYALQLRLLSLKPLSVSLSGFLHPNCAIKPSGNKPPGLKEIKPAKKGQTEVP